MNEPNLAVAVYATYAEAEDGVRKLQRASFELRLLSIIGKGFRSEDFVAGWIGTLGALGVPGDPAQRYETALKAGRFLLVMNTNPAGIARAHAVLGGAELAGFDHHAMA